MSLDVNEIPMNIWNIDSILGLFRLERDSKLTALEERADALEDGAAQFEKQAGSLKNKYASNNLIIAAVVGVLVLGGFYWYLFMQPPPAPGVVIVKLPFQMTFVYFFVIK